MKRIRFGQMGMSVVAVYEVLMRKKSEIRLHTRAMFSAIDIVDATRYRRRLSSCSSENKIANAAAYKSWHWVGFSFGKCQFSNYLLNVNRANRLDEIKLLRIRVASFLRIQ